MTYKSQDEIKAEFAKRLWALMRRKRAGIESELARRAGLKRGSISEYMRAEALPSRVNRERLAGVLGLTPDELFPDTAESLGIVLELSTVADKPSALHVY